MAGGDTIVAPFDSAQGEGGERVVIKGPAVPIGGGAVTSFALLLHEFAANAAKYGALSSASGCVKVTWSVEESELKLTWNETGGPHLNGQPEAEGFGSLLTRVAVGGQLKGRISRDWSPDGLTISLAVPLDCPAA